MKKLLKRWAAVPYAIAWVVLVYVSIVVLVVCGLVWLIVGRDTSDASFRYMRFLMEDYWFNYTEWVRV